MLILEDFRTHREGLLSQGFWALQIYRFGCMRSSIRFRPIRAIWFVIHLLLSKFSEIAFGIYIGSTARIGRRLNIEHFGCIVIHGSAVIGDDCVIRQGVTLGNRSSSSIGDAPVIGNRVKIGAGAKVLGRVFVGNDVLIGANAVVLTDIPDGAIAVGVPARIILKKK